MDSASQCLPDRSEGNPVWSNFIFWYPLPVYFIKMCLGHAKECGSEYWNLLLETWGHVLLCHWARSVNTGCVYHCVSYTDFRPECCPDQVKYILSIWIQVPVNQILVRNINLGFWKLYMMKHLICKWPCLYLTPPPTIPSNHLFFNQFCPQLILCEELTCNSELFQTPEIHQGSQRSCSALLIWAFHVWH